MKKTLLLTVLVIFTLSVFAGIPTTDELQDQNSDWFDSHHIPTYVLVIKTIVMGVVTSFFFLIILASLRPRIAISKHIAHDSDSYYIKIVNKSRLFRMHNIKAELRMAEPIGGVDSMNVRLKVLKLSNNRILYMPRRKRAVKDEKKEFAYWFKITEDLNSMFSKSENISIEFSLVANHSFSGFPKTLKQVYFSDSAIKNGRFESGISTKIS